MPSIHVSDHAVLRFAQRIASSWGSFKTYREMHHFLRAASMRGVVIGETDEGARLMRDPQAPNVFEMVLKTNATGGWTVVTVLDPQVQTVFHRN